MRTDDAEKVFTDINGARQGMFIQSPGSGRPALLYLHGGLPEYFLTERYPTGLENDFTVTAVVDRDLDCVAAGHDCLPRGSIALA
jgi:hypothetical protein